jgi:hypothetical protein
MRKKYDAPLTLELKNKVLDFLQNVPDPEPAQVEMTAAEMVAELKSAIFDLQARKFTLKQIADFCTQAGFPIPESSLKSYLSRMDKKKKPKPKPERQDPARPPRRELTQDQGKVEAQVEEKTVEQKAIDKGFSSSAVEDKLIIPDKI